MEIIDEMALSLERYLNFMMSYLHDIKNLTPCDRCMAITFVAIAKTLTKMVAEITNDNIQDKNNFFDSFVQMAENFLNSKSSDKDRKKLN